jgi:hypothetical protein
MMRQRAIKVKNPRQRLEALKRAVLRAEKILKRFSK